jgi:hypothetical protein
VTSFSGCVAQGLPTIVQRYYRALADHSDVPHSAFHARDGTASGLSANRYRWIELSEQIMIRRVRDTGQSWYKALVSGPGNSSCKKSSVAPFHVSHLSPTAPNGICINARCALFAPYRKLGFNGRQYRFGRWNDAVRG